MTVEVSRKDSKALKTREEKMGRERDRERERESGREIERERAGKR